MRGSTRGALITAIEVPRPKASLPASSTIKLRLLFTTCGNGCAGSSTIGVSSGRTCCSKNSLTQARWASFRSSCRKSKTPCFAKAGKICLFSIPYCWTTSTWHSGLVPSRFFFNSRCSLSPPLRSRASKLAILTSKNSSRLLETMHK